MPHRLVFPEDSPVQPLASDQQKPFPDDLEERLRTRTTGRLSPQCRVGGLEERVSSGSRVCGHVNNTSVYQFPVQKLVWLFRDL